MGSITDIQSMVHSWEEFVIYQTIELTAVIAAIGLFWLCVKRRVSDYSGYWLCTLMLFTLNPQTNRFIGGDESFDIYRPNDIWLFRYQSSGLLQNVWPTYFE